MARRGRVAQEEQCNARKYCQALGKITSDLISINSFHQIKISTPSL